MNRFADQTPPDRRNSVRSDTVRVLVAVSETASSELFEPSLRAAEGSQRTTPLATSPPPAPSPSGPRMNSERGCVSSQKRPLGRPKIAPEIPLPANAQDDLTPFWGSRSAPRQFRGGRRKRSGRNPADRTFALSRGLNQIPSTREIPSRPIAALGHRSSPRRSSKVGVGRDLGTGSESLSATNLAALTNSSNPLQLQQFQKGTFCSFAFIRRNGPRGSWIPS